MFFFIHFQVNGFMTNTAHSVIFYTGPYYDEGSEPDGGGSRGEDAFMSANMGGAGSQSNSSPRVLVNITGGPLSYRYQFHEIHIHYGYDLYLWFTGMTYRSMPLYYLWL